MSASALILLENALVKCSIHLITFLIFHLRKECFQIILSSLFKADDTADLSNRGQKSILPKFSKILDRLIFIITIIY